MRLGTGLKHRHVREGGDISRNPSCVLLSLSKSHLSRLGRRLGQIPSSLGVFPLYTMTSQDPYLCDTIPQAKLAQATTNHPPPPSSTSQTEKSSVSDSLGMGLLEDVHPIPGPPQRKLCPRHKRMADEGTNLKLQQVRDCQISSVPIMLTYVPLRLWTLSLSRSGRL